jgi:hypothetical protein
MEEVQEGYEVEGGLVSQRRGRVSAREDIRVAGLQRFDRLCSGM